MGGGRRVFVFHQAKDLIEINNKNNNNNSNLRLDSVHSQCEVYEKKCISSHDRTIREGGIWVRERERERKKCNL
jgi:hypothetical protein